MNYITSSIFKAILIFLTIPLVLSQKIPQTRVLPLIPDYQDSLFSGPKPLGRLENKKIDEASGLAFSRTHPGILYTHNDSGGEPSVYLIDTLGKDWGKIILSGVKNRDWEDIAIGPGPDPMINYIYVGEIGDNNGEYDHVKIYRFPEPKEIEEKMVVKPEILKLYYPEGPRDAETLMIDPITQDIFILSKRDSLNILYKAPQDAFKAKKFELEKVLELPFTMSVAADISKDGSQIIIKNYFTVYYWQRHENESIPKALSRKAQILPYKPEPQGESITFHPSGKSYYTLSEKRFNIDPVLYRYDKK
ncbi:hypothetical protein [Shivajiella indica]|uniref:Integral membrane protein n=1 Tax=Shivajiella indica TaxID=872115 RepID=A0ABW5BBE9_9BACT